MANEEGTGPRANGAEMQKIATAFSEVVLNTHLNEAAKDQDSRRIPGDVSACIAWAMGYGLFAGELGIALQPQIDTTQAGQLADHYCEIIRKGYLAALLVHQTRTPPSQGN